MILTARQPVDVRASSRDRAPLPGYIRQSMIRITAHRAPAAPAPNRPLIDRLMGGAARIRWVLFALILIAYLAGFNGQWRIDEDSALYLTLARNIADGHGYTLDGQPHDAVEPAVPYLLAGLQLLAGEHFTFTVQAVMLVMGLAALALVYALVRTRFDRPYAVTLVVLLACTHLFYRHALDLTTELPFLWACSPS